MKPGSPEWHERVTMMKLQEMIKGDFRWWWLSFADGNRPKGQQFLGACMVQGWGMLTAVAEAHARRINPGGEVAGAPLPEGAPDPLPEWTNRLLTKAECEAYDRFVSGNSS
jgi:hypothetical protein